MENIEKFVQKQENLDSVIAVVNMVCEYSEKQEDKLSYAVRMFHVFAKELHKHGKISNELYETCEYYSEEQIEKYINDVIKIWNKNRPLIQRIRRFFRKLKFCNKNN